MASVTYPPPLRDVLIAVNQIRRERGLPPRERLSRGSHNSHTCPLALALGAVSVYGGKARFSDGTAVYFGERYAVLREFLGAFDHIRPPVYPELEKGA